MWSRASTATPTTLPSVQLSGSGFGHVASNWNAEASDPSWAPPVSAASRGRPATMAAATASTRATSIEE